VDTRSVRVSPGLSSGVAVITVEASGQNQIVVVAGANGEVTADDLDGALWGAVKVLVCQMEVPMAANLAALRRARAAGVQTIFNSAPVSSPIPEEVYRLADIFCPNESEAELLTGVAVHSIEDARRAAAELRRRGAAAALITLGKRGCLYVDEFQDLHIAAPVVTAVDTTGAGDAFVGSLAFFLAEGVPIVAAIERAQAIAAISVQSPGAQSSYPRRAALPAALL
jgi:ribokinase